MGEMAWVIQINDEDEQIAEIRQRQEEWELRCIYKLPTCVTDLNKNAYKPRAVSFGPYHHGDPNLKALEDQKHRVLFHFLKRSKQPLQKYFDALNEVVQVLMGAYDSLDQRLLQNKDEFLQLMIRDGCFMLEILRTFTQRKNEDGGYADNDPIFSKHGKLYMMPYMKRDMLMLENQLPLLVLDKLLAVEHPEIQEDKEFINRLVLKFCFPQFPDEDIKKFRLGKCLHVLHVYRKGLLEVYSASQAAEAESQTETSPGDNASLFKKISTIIRDRGCGGSSRGAGTGSSADGIDVGSGGGNDAIIRSATELQEAGIRIKKSKTDSLKDITFQGGILRLPSIVVDDITEPMFLNLIAFERSHVGTGNEVTAYIFFMDNIIDNAKDVSLLHSCGIIQNAIGSDKAAAHLFNTLSKDVTLDPDNRQINEVQNEVILYCKKWWPRCRAALIHTHFRSPWSIVSFIAAIFLFVLTIVQTIYTAGQYYQSLSGTTSSNTENKEL